MASVEQLLNHPAYPSSVLALIVDIAKSNVNMTKT